MTLRPDPTHRSLWIVTSPAPKRPILGDRFTADVAILGAGIVGVTATFALKRAGLTVALIEADRVLEGVTGRTTAKVTSSHGPIYARLLQDHGEEKARLYGEANESAIDHIERTASEERIECEFERLDNYLFTTSEDRVPDLEEEARVAADLGLPAEFTTDVPIGLDTRGAVRFARQAQFHPLKYLWPLAAAVDGRGSRVFEGTRALEVHEGEPCRVVTDRGEVFAKDVIVATHFPILDRGLYFARMAPRREYVVAMRPGPGSPAGAMFVEAGGVTVRAARDEVGPLVIVGGENHKPGTVNDTEQRYARLEAFARENLGCRELAYHWSTQDNDSFDGLPFAGRLYPFSRHLYTATGFSGWGMTNGTATGLLLADLILGRANPYAGLYDPGRLNLQVSGEKMLHEGAGDAARFVTGRLTARNLAWARELGRGEGAVFRPGIHPVAVNRGLDGQLRAVSAVCTHLGCVVSWNSAEQSWDCPCHGSRFAGTGDVLHGPAVRPLPAVPIGPGGNDS
ncbi:MAG TPA: FAD-dependent oxidoreductase [Deinococcales bacterium]|nr:FAD-dependent oxidoreductase [Deinococcales bacterium]